MYAIVILRYRKSFEEVSAVLDVHRAYLRKLKDQGLLIASGPFEPRNGGCLLLRVPDDGAMAKLDQIREADPYIQTGAAQYEMWPWSPVLGRDELDRL